MRKLPAIQNFIAALLLGLFAVGSVPEGLWHEALAVHTDAADCVNETPDQDCVHQRDFNCGFTNWVIASPYEAVNPVAHAAPPVDFLLLSKTLYRRTLQQCLVDTEGRGPPPMMA